MEVVLHGVNKNILSIYKSTYLNMNLEVGSKGGFDNNNNKKEILIRANPKDRDFYNFIHGWQVSGSDFRTGDP